MIVEDKYEEENLKSEDSCDEKKIECFLPFHPERDEKVSFYSVLLFGKSVEIVVGIG